jgi:hypothetical protein
VSPVRYELGFYMQKMAFIIVTAVKTSNITSTSSNSVHINVDSADLRYQEDLWAVRNLPGRLNGNTAVNRQKESSSTLLTSVTVNILAMKQCMYTEVRPCVDFQGRENVNSRC